MRLIDLDELLKFPIRRNHCDKENANPHFINGIETVFEYAEQLPTLGWIPVTERLPENDYGKHGENRKHYLVCLKYGTLRVATFGFKEYDWWVDSHDCVLSDERYTGVAYWMPLPDAPKDGDT